MNEIFLLAFFVHILCNFEKFLIGFEDNCEKFTRNKVWAIYETQTLCL